MLSAVAPHGITLVSRLSRRLRIEFSVIVSACLAIRHDALTRQHRRRMGQSHAVDGCICNLLPSSLLPLIGTSVLSQLTTRNSRVDFLYGQRERGE